MEGSVNENSISLGVCRHLHGLTPDLTQKNGRHPSALKCKATIKINFPALCFKQGSPHRLSGSCDTQSHDVEHRSRVDSSRKCVETARNENPQAKITEAMFKLAT